MDQARSNLSRWLGTWSRPLICQREKYKRRLGGHLENTPRDQDFDFLGLDLLKKLREWSGVAAEGQWIQKQRGRDSAGRINAAAWNTETEGKSQNCREQPELPGTGSTQQSEKLTQRAEAGTVGTAGNSRNCREQSALPRTVGTAGNSQNWWELPELSRTAKTAKNCRNSQSICLRRRAACKGQLTNIGTVVWYLAANTPSMQCYS